MRNVFYSIANIKTFLAIAILTGFFSISCNPIDKKIKDKTEVTDGGDETDTKSAFAKDVCNCMDNLDLSSKAKKIIIKAGNSDDPTTSMKNQLQNIEDEAEKQKITNEIAGLKSVGNDPCFKKLEKKYPEYKNPDKKTQKQLISVMEDKCELGAAMIKFAMAADNQKNNNE